MSDVWDVLGSLCLLAALFGAMGLVITHSRLVQDLLLRWLLWASGRQIRPVVTPAERYAIDESIKASVTAAIAQMTDAADWDLPEELDPDKDDLDAIYEAFYDVTDRLADEFPLSFEDGRALYSPDE